MPVAADEEANEDHEDPDAEIDIDELVERAARADKLRSVPPLIPAPSTRCRRCGERYAVGLCLRCEGTAGVRGSGSGFRKVPAQTIES